MFETLPVAIEHLDRAIANFEATSSGFVEFRVGPNPGVVANAVSGLVRWMGGFPDTAVDRMDAAVRVARDLDHPYSIAYALHHAALLDLWRGDFDSVAARGAESRALATTHDYPTWLALAFVLGGAAEVASGAREEGLRSIEQGFEAYRGLSTPPVFWPALLTIRASAYGLAGQFDRGLELVDEAEANLMPDDPLGIDVAIAKADLLLATPNGDRPGAETVLERAVAMARPRGGRMGELEALTRLAELRRAEAPDAETIRRLREVYETFTEGSETRQLERARTVLADGSERGPSLG
jgi:hypothetical protein